MEIIKAKASQMKVKPESLDGIKFGHCYADHMMEADWDYEKGWSHPLVSPLHHFQMHPGAKVNYVINFLVYDRFLGFTLCN